MKSKVLWTTKWDISQKIFTQRKYGNFCTNGKSVWQSWETMFKKINSLSVIEVLMEKNNPIYWILFVNTCKNIYIKYGSKNIFLSLIND